MKKGLIITLLLLLFPIVSAQPVVTNVIGSLQEEATISVTGSNFLSSPIPHILAWEDFDSGTIGAQITSQPKIGSWSLIEPTRIPTYSSDSHKGLSAYYSNPNGGYHSNFEVDLPGDIHDKYYIAWRYKFYANLGVETGQTKLFQLWGNGPQGGDYDPGVMAGGFSGNWFASYIIPDSGSNLQQSWYTGAPSVNNWHYIEAILEQSDPGVANGRAIIKNDYQDVYNQQNKVTRNNPIYNWNLMRVFYGFTNMNGLTSTYLDDIYLATSWARIEVGNAQTYSSSTKRELQIPTSWTTNNIEFDLDLGTFTQQEIDNGLYLFIIDENNVASQGFLLADSSPVGPKTCADISQSPCFEISSCGYYDQDGYYLLTQNLTSDASCMFLNADITLDLNGFTITFADGYTNLTNFDFEEWNNGQPVGWDVSQASGARRATREELQLDQEASLYLPNSGSVIVSDWVYLPKADRTYRGYVLHRSKLEQPGPNMKVELEGVGIICEKNFDHYHIPEVNDGDYYGQGRVDWCNFNNRPAGNYRLIITTRADQTYLDIAGISPALDMGVGSINSYRNSCQDYTGAADDTPCRAPDYNYATASGNTITITNGKIEAGSYNYASKALDFYNVGGNVDINNLKISNVGVDSYAIVSSSPGDISYNEIFVYQPWISWRDDTNLAANWINNQDFHNNIAVGGQGVISLNGPARIYDNLLRNEQRVTNHYTITNSGGSNAEVFRNVFDPIKGGHFLLYSAEGFTIYDNDFYVSSEPCIAEYSDEDYTVNAIRMNDYGSARTKNNEIYNNRFYITGYYEENPYHPGCKPVTTGIFYSNNGVGNRIHNNSFFVEKQSDISRLDAYALYIGGDAINPVGNPLFVNNIIESNDRALWITTYYGFTENIWLENNTFKRINNNYYNVIDPTAGIQIGRGTSRANNIRLINNKFVDYDPDRYYFTGTSGSYDLTKENYLHVRVENSGQPVSGVSVTAVGDNTVSGITDSNGLVTLRLTEYTQSGTTNGANTNKIVYSDYLVSAIHNAQEYQYPLAIIPTQEQTIVIDLGVQPECNNNNICEPDLNEFVGLCSDCTCGDGIINGNDVCDGSDFGGLSCQDFGYSSGTLTCQSDCQAYQVNTCVNEIIIDNNQLGTSKSGNWVEGGSSFPGFYGVDYAYSYDTSNSFYEWQTSLSPGIYDVSIMWSYNTARPANVEYLVYHDLGTYSEIISQQVNPNGWYSLGEFEFTNQGRIRLNVGGTSVQGTSADAVRFTRVGDIVIGGPNYDFDTDGDIDLDDLYILVQNFGLSYTQGDYDNDGTITIKDLVTHIKNWN